MGFVVLAPEKRGVRPNDLGCRCTDEYMLTNDRAQRAHDAELLLAQLSSVVPAWDGRLVIIGASEGAVVAPQIAARCPALTGVILLGGGGWTQARELASLERRRLEAADAPRERVDRSLADLSQAVRTIVGEPLSTRTWLGHGNTYRRWASYLEYSPLVDLSRIEAPIFMANGARDQSTPIESAEAVAAEFAHLGKQNLTLKRYERLDHEWRDDLGGTHLREVADDVLDWLRSTVPVRGAPLT
jgi:pimeloyl-ACP methyl ester carboxylesterase